MTSALIRAIIVMVARREAMKTPITYTVVRGDKVSYEMKAGAVLLGICTKVGPEFLFTPHENLGVSFEVRKPTMKGLKEGIEQQLPEILKEKIDGENTKVHHFTVFEAMRFAGLSHSEVRILLHEIYTFHRYLSRNQYGDFMVRRTMENQAEFTWGNYARVWLRKNPGVGLYRAVYPEMYALYAKRMHVHSPGEIEDAA